MGGAGIALGAYLGCRMPGTTSRIVVARGFSAVSTDGSVPRFRFKVDEAVAADIDVDRPGGTVIEPPSFPLPTIRNGFDYGMVN